MGWLPAHGVRLPKDKEQWHLLQQATNHLQLSWHWRWRAKCSLGVLLLWGDRRAFLQSLLLLIVQDNAGLAQPAYQTYPTARRNSFERVFRFPVTKPPGQQPSGKPKRPRGQRSLVLLSSQGEFHCDFNLRNTNPRGSL